MGSGVSDCELRRCDGCGEYSYFHYRKGKGTRYCFNCQNKAAAQLHRTYGGREKIQPASDRLVANMLKKAEGAESRYRWEDIIALVLRIKDETTSNNQER
jgi:hypothetical protein